MDEAEVEVMAVVDQEEDHQEVTPTMTTKMTKRKRPTANQMLKAQKKYHSPSHNPQEGQPAHQVLGLPVHQEKENKPEE